MQRFELTVDNNKIPFVTRLEVETFYRKESHFTNLEGDAIIDRGKIKYKVTVNIALASSGIIDILETARRKIFFSVIFSDNTQQKTINAFCEPIVRGSPRYLYKNKDLGIYYSNVEVVFEER